MDIGQQGFDTCFVVRAGALWPTKPDTCLAAGVVRSLTDGRVATGRRSVVGLVHGIGAQIGARKIRSRCLTGWMACNNRVM